MKLALFAAALLGLSSAVQLSTADSYDLDQDYFSQIDSNTFGEGLVGSQVITDAECETLQNGVVIRLQTPECQQKAAAVEPQLSFEQQMLLALQELSGKSMELYDALKIQFTKNQKLAEAKTMSISGTIAVTPKIEDCKPLEEAPAPCPEPAPQPVINITAEPVKATTCDPCAQKVKEAAAAETTDGSKTTTDGSKTTTTETAAAK